MPEVSNKKDAWDRLMALATILIPAAIALAGHFVAQGLKQAEISSEDRRADQSHEIAEANTKIAQANFISTMMKSLTSSDQQERLLAVQAVLIAMPEQGPVLVRTIAENDASESVKAKTKTSMEQTVELLIHNLFSENAQLRKAAAQSLIQGYRNESNVVLKLVNFANRNMENKNGIYNTVVVLNEFSIRALEANKQEVLEFIKHISGSKTKAKANALARRLGE
ncbi:MAG: hypothetical protein JSW64_14715 [Candidatus Zixiibacteriota bacterium]|nr:MAG: hypothetical protein JSW64_14715 [candidate division Zixibacteria bacterium]